MLASATPPPSADPAPAAGRLRGFLSCREATPATDATVVQGRLPEWLRGSLLLNGPAVWDLPGGGYRHWFDGLALLHRVHFTGDRVRYHSRFLDTEDARLSRARGRPELGGYGTAAAGGLLSRILRVSDPRRTDNGCVTLGPCDGQWLALTESDRATRVDPDTLDSLGELRWTDGLALPLMSAHPEVDAKGTWWNVGIRFGRRCEYLLVSADRSGRRTVKARIATARPGHLHAFALGAGHAVIWESAWRAHPLRFLLAGESYAAHFDWLPRQGSRLHVVNLADGGVSSWESPPLSLFHAVQTYRQGDDVVVDLCLNDGPVVDELDIARLRAGAPTSAPRARHARFVLSPGRTDAREETLPGRFELPRVHTERALAGPVRYVWAATGHADGAFFDRTIKLDHITGRIVDSGRDDRIALEPVFVPAPGAHEEDEGVLLVHTLDDEGDSRLRVLDAASLAERAVVQLPVVVPFGFHGAWRPG